MTPAPHTPRPPGLPPSPHPTPAPRLRVLVVEDSITIRKYLVSLLSADPNMTVVGEAADGNRATELCATLRPDVVTMDMMLPGLSGLAATEYIMAFCPTPILIVSASVNRGEAFQTYQALAAGAVDVLDKIRLHEPSRDWEQRFLAAVRMVARIKVITHPRGRLAPSQAFQPPQSPATSAAFIPSISLFTPTPRAGVSLIAIGASTGGPAAIADILKALPRDFPLPIVIVLHISELFAFAFAEWLNTLSPIPARYVRDREPIPEPGVPQILLAPAGHHLLVDCGAFRLRDTPERNSCRPSVDVLFESLGPQLGPRALLCLLTGMGKDGASGMLAGFRSGAETVAQDEASSIVFGMPAEAIRLGAARHTLPLTQIAPFFIAAAAPHAHRRVPLAERTPA